MSGHVERQGLHKVRDKKSRELHTEVLTSCPAAGSESLARAEDTNAKHDAAGFLLVSTTPELTMKTNRVTRA